MSDIERHVMRSHVLSVETINCFLGTFWPIFFVGVIWIIVADETKLSNVVLLKNERFDISVFSKESLNICVTHCKRNVLDIDVVDESSEGSSILWLEFNSNSYLIILTLPYSLCSRLFLIEADETITS